MIATSIEPVAGAEQWTALKECNSRLVRRLEGHLPVERDVLSQMTDLLGQVVRQTPAWVDVLRQVRDGGDYHLVRLLHDDNAVLNMPWAMASDPVSNGALGTIRQLTLAKCPARLAGDHDAAQVLSVAAPLKVLVMISSPDDSEYDKRLSFEEEEFLILQAFSPLMESGQVEIDFTDDGSLESLERKLKANRYHILHVSGHAVFKDGEGKLQLEHPLSLKTAMTPAEDFAGSVNCDPDYRVPLVVLACCQSAQGDVEKGLAGITNRLLGVGVPAVVAMGASVSDHYAALFAASFYREIAERRNVPLSFAGATEYLRQREYEDQATARVAHPQALQWVIPNLYLRTPLEHLVDWQVPHEKLTFTSHRYVVQNQRLVLKHDEQFRFIGRRRDKAAILPALHEQRPILLRGQGGVGKTELAEHLIQRLIAAHPRTQPFVFTEATRNIRDILDPLRAFLIEHDQFDALAYDRLDKGLEKLLLLVGAIGKLCDPVFVFDNLETFQAAAGGAFRAEFEDIRDAIALLCARGRDHVILTARYPLPDFAEVCAFDLNQVGLNDFWRKCHHLGLYRIAAWLREQGAAPSRSVARAGPALQFIDVVKLLHTTFGGNYRALEFFDRRFQQDAAACREAIGSLEAFQAKYKDETEAVRLEMAQDLAFDSLLAMVRPEQLALLRLLQGFRIPVMADALEDQLQENGEAMDRLDAQLLRLQELTLVEISLDPEIGYGFYYVTPIVRDLLARADVQADAVTRATFSHQRAGAYHFHMFHNDLSTTLTELEEAFFHFHLARNAERVTEIGERLSRFFYDASLYRSALHYASQASDVLGDATTPDLLNRLGLIYDLYGQYDTALEYYERSLTILQEIGDRSGEGTTLNNIASIHHAKGEYDTALSYLQRSLTISQEIGDKKGEGTTLNNISGIHHAKGEYDTALSYLQRSLTIRQEIGDRSGMIATLHNMGMIALQKEDMAKFAEYEMQAYAIAKETGDAMGLFQVGRVVGQILFASGHKKEGLAVIRESYEIGRKGGLPGTEKVAELIRQMEQS